MTDQEKKELAVSEKKTVDAESGEPTREGLTYVPHVDIAEDAESITLRADLPGIDEKDVKLELSNNTLTIRGEKRQEHEEKDRDHYRIERSYGSFQRVLSLPEDADQSGTTAKFKNGVLTVKLPRRPEEKKDLKVIDIQKE